MFPLTVDPRTISECDFPTEGTSAEQWCFLLHYAVLAPSEYNSQPWYFKIRGPICELYADYSRQLLVVDPDKRELLISCGGAFLNLRLALRHFGYGEELNLRTIEEQPALLARIKIGSPVSATAEEERLFFAIQKRVTNRSMFEARPIAEELLTRCEELAGEEGVWLYRVTGQNHQMVSEMIATGDHMLWEKKAFRHELAHWVHGQREIIEDGLPAFSAGKGNIAGIASPWLVRTVNLGRAEAAKSQHLVTSAPLLIILGTYSDMPADWFATGQAMEKILLLATASGVQNSFVNQPIEVSALRTQLHQMIGQYKHPQLVLRLGYGPDAPVTPRRSVSDVLLDVQQRPHGAYNL